MGKILAGAKERGPQSLVSGKECEREQPRESEACGKFNLQAPFVVSPVLYGQKTRNRYFLRGSTVTEAGGMFTLGALSQCWRLCFQSSVVPREVAPPSAPSVDGFRRVRSETCCCETLVDSIAVESGFAFCSSMLLEAQILFLATFRVGCFCPQCVQVLAQL